MEQIKNIIVGIVLSVLAYLKPIEGELSALFLIFFLNFFFGYLSGTIANGEDFQFKKALRCVGYEHPKELETSVQRGNNAVDGYSILILHHEV